MLISIGGTEIWVCRLSYQVMGATESFQGLGSDESYWSLMGGSVAPNPDYSFEDLGISESFHDIGISESYLSTIPKNASAWDTGIIEGSFSLEDHIEERSICDFQVRDLGGGKKTIPTDGSPHRAA